jgi:hypothetical protein
MTPPERLACAAVLQPPDAVLLDPEYLRSLHDKSLWPAEFWAEVQAFATLLEGGHLREDLSRYVIVKDGRVSVGYDTEAEAAEAADAVGVIAGLIMRVGRDDQVRVFKPVRHSS